MAMPVVYGSPLAAAAATGMKVCSATKRLPDAMSLGNINVNFCGGSSEASVGACEVSTREDSSASSDPSPSHISSEVYTSSTPRTGSGQRSCSQEAAVSTRLLTDVSVLPFSRSIQRGVESPTFRGVVDATTTAPPPPTAGGIDSKKEAPSPTKAHPPPSLSPPLLAQGHRKGSLETGEPLFLNSKSQTPSSSQSPFQSLRREFGHGASDLFSLRTGSNPSTVKKHTSASERPSARQRSGPSSVVPPSQTDGSNMSVMARSNPHLSALVDLLDHKVFTEEQVLLELEAIRKRTLPTSAPFKRHLLPILAWYLLREKFGEDTATRYVALLKSPAAASNGGEAADASYSIPSFLPQVNDLRKERKRAKELYRKSPMHPYAIRAPQSPTPQQPPTAGAPTATTARRSRRTTAFEALEDASDLPSATTDARNGSCCIPKAPQTPPSPRTHRVRYDRLHTYTREQVMEDRREARAKDRPVLDVVMDAADPHARASNAYKVIEADASSAVEEPSVFRGPRPDSPAVVAATMGSETMPTEPVEPSPPSFCELTANTTTLTGSRRESELSTFMPTAVARTIKPRRDEKALFKRATKKGRRVQRSSHRGVRGKEQKPPPHGAPSARKRGGAADAVVKDAHHHSPQPRQPTERAQRPPRSGASPVKMETTSLDTPQLSNILAVTGVADSGPGIRSLPIGNNQSSGLPGPAEDAQGFIQELEMENDVPVEDRPPSIIGDTPTGPAEEAAEGAAERSLLGRISQQRTLMDAGDASRPVTAVVHRSQILAFPAQTPSTEFRAKEDQRSVLSYGEVDHFSSFTVSVTGYYSMLPDASMTTRQPSSSQQSHGELPFALSSTLQSPRSSLMPLVTETVARNASNSASAVRDQQPTELSALEKIALERELDTDGARSERTLDAQRKPSGPQRSLQGGRDTCRQSSPHTRAEAVGEEVISSAALVVSQTLAVEERKLCLSRISLDISSNGDAEDTAETACITSLLPSEVCFSSTADPLAPYGAAPQRVQDPSHFCAEAVSPRTSIDDVQHTFGSLLQEKHNTSENDASPSEEGWAKVAQSLVTGSNTGIAVECPSVLYERGTTNSAIQPSNVKPSSTNESSETAAHAQYGSILEPSPPPVSGSGRTAAFDQGLRQSTTAKPLTARDLAAAFTDSLNGSSTTDNDDTPSPFTEISGAASRVGHGSVLGADASAASQVISGYSALGVTSGSGAASRVGHGSVLGADASAASQVISGYSALGVTSGSGAASRVGHGSVLGADTSAASLVKIYDSALHAPDDNGIHSQRGSQGLVKDPIMRSATQSATVAADVYPDSSILDVAKLEEAMRRLDVAAVPCGEGNRDCTFGEMGCRCATAQAASFAPPLPPLASPSPYHPAPPKDSVAVAKPFPRTLAAAAAPASTMGGASSSPFSDSAATPELAATAQGQPPCNDVGLSEIPTVSTAASGMPDSGVGITRSPPRDVGTPVRVGTGFNLRETSQRPSPRRAGRPVQSSNETNVKATLPSSSPVQGTKGGLPSLRKQDGNGIDHSPAAGLEEGVGHVTILSDTGDSVSVKMHNRWSSSVLFTEAQMGQRCGSNEIPPEGRYPHGDESFLMAPVSILTSPPLHKPLGKPNPLDRAPTSREVDTLPAAEAVGDTVGVIAVPEAPVVNPTDKGSFAGHEEGKTRTSIHGASQPLDGTGSVEQVLTRGEDGTEMDRSLDVHAKHANLTALLAFSRWDESRFDHRSTATWETPRGIGVGSLLRTPSVTVASTEVESLSAVSTAITEASTDDTVSISSDSATAKGSDEKDLLETSHLRTRLEGVSLSSAAEKEVGSHQVPPLPPRKRETSSERVHRQRWQAALHIPGVPYVDSPDISTVLDQVKARRKERAREEFVAQWARRGLVWQRQEWQAQLIEEEQAWAYTGAAPARHAVGSQEERMAAGPHRRIAAVPTPALLPATNPRDPVTMPDGGAFAPGRGKG